MTLHVAESKGIVNLRCFDFGILFAASIVALVAGFSIAIYTAFAYGNYLQPFVQVNCTIFDAKNVQLGESSFATVLNVTHNAVYKSATYNSNNNNNYMISKLQNQRSKVTVCNYHETITQRNPHQLRDTCASTKYPIGASFPCMIEMSSAGQKVGIHSSSSVIYALIFNVAYLSIHCLAYLLVGYTILLGMGALAIAACFNYGEAQRMVLGALPGYSGEAGDKLASDTGSKKKSKKNKHKNEQDHDSSEDGSFKLAFSKECEVMSDSEKQQQLTLLNENYRELLARSANRESEKILWHCTSNSLGVNFRLHTSFPIVLLVVSVTSCLGLFGYIIAHAEVLSMVSMIGFVLFCMAAVYYPFRSYYYLGNVNVMITTGRVVLYTQRFFMHYEIQYLNYNEIEGFERDAAGSGCVKIRGRAQQVIDDEESAVNMANNVEERVSEIEIHPLIMRLGDEDRIIQILQKGMYFCVVCCIVCIVQ